MNNRNLVAFSVVMSVLVFALLGILSFSHINEGIKEQDKFIKQKEREIKQREEIMKYREEMMKLKEEIMSQKERINSSRKENQEQVKRENQEKVKREKVKRENQEKVKRENQNNNEDQYKDMSAFHKTIAKLVLELVERGGGHILVSRKVFFKTLVSILQKISTKATASTIGKKIPVFGALVGFAMAGARAISGDFGGAAFEATSGLLGATGVGEVASLAIDAGLIARDVYNALKEEKIVS